MKVKNYNLLCFVELRVSSIRLVEEARQAVGVALKNEDVYMNTTFDQFIQKVSTGALVICVCEIYIIKYEIICCSSELDFAVK